MKKENGIITIEASIVLPFFMMFILFFMGLTRVHTAQNIVSHGTIQAAKSMSINSYLRKSVAGTATGKIITFVTAIFVSEDDPVGNPIANNLLPLSDPGVALNQVIKENFVRSIAEDEQEANAILIGVGIDSIDFSESQVKGEDIIIVAKYTVKLQFPFLKEKEVSLVKTAKSRMFGK